MLLLSRLKVKKCHHDLHAFWWHSNTVRLASGGLRQYRFLGTSRNSMALSQQQHSSLQHRPISILRTIHNSYSIHIPRCRSCFSSDATNSAMSRTTTNTAPPSLDEAFPRHDILNAWGSDLAPLEDAALDRSTRYMVQLLTAQYQRLHWSILSGTNQTTTTFIDDDDNDDSVLDCATTERCNRVMENLSMATTVTQGRATRADELLRGMQAFYSIPTSSAINRPAPTADTYFMVLRLFASDPTANPHRAGYIVETMKERYHEYGQLDHEPNVVLWNQVLSCWAVSQVHDDKAFQAANLLQKLKQNDAITLDTSSYAHVLRACAKADWSAKSKLLGAQVALKVYSDFRKQQEQQPTESSTATAGTRWTLAPTPYIYTYYFQATAHLADSKRRIQAAIAAYHDAADYGCVNEYVLDNFRQAVDDIPLFRKTVGEQLFGNYTPTPQLLSRLPARVKRNNGSKKQ